MFPIFHTYTLNDLLLDTQLSVELGWYLLLGAFLSYIVMFIFSEIFLYLLYLMISAIWRSR